MPRGFQLGPIYIYFYGIILVAGAVAAALLAEREARRRGQNGDLVWDGLIWVLVGGIIGARLWHVFTVPESMVAQGITTMYYLTHPLDLINIRNGGLGIPGAIIGGGLALYFFCRRRKLNFPLWLDIAAPSVALGQAIGRWGNFTNQELYGPPTDLPWGIYIEAEGARFHPLFLYESLLNLGNMAFLLWLGRRYADRLKPGDIFLTYLVIYATGRFLLEFIRLDVPRVAGINVNQALMGVIAIIAAVALFLRHREKPVQAVEENS
jgi:phosphatidylglycerol:prolipoprotein diacylglycerol transferase